jgi:hypothetical protein
LRFDERPGDHLTNGRTSADIESQCLLLAPRSRTKNQNCFKDRRHRPA